MSKPGPARVRRAIGGLHPAKFHAEMLRIALAAGAVVHAETAALGILQDGDGYEVTTSRGKVQARNVIAGTNGYTDRSNPWLQRRLALEDRGIDQPKRRDPPRVAGFHCCLQRIINVIA